MTARTARVTATRPSALMAEFLRWQRLGYTDQTAMVLALAKHLTATSPETEAVVGRLRAYADDYRSRCTTVTRLELES